MKGLVLAILIFAVPTAAYADLSRAQFEKAEEAAEYMCRAMIHVRINSVSRDRLTEVRVLGVMLKQTMIANDASDEQLAAIQEMLTNYMTLERANKTIDGYGFDDELYWAQKRISEISGE